MEVSLRSYSANDAAVWGVIFPQDKKFLQKNACAEYLKGLEDLGYRANCIPNLDELNKKLHRLTGWTVVPVAGLVDSAIFWDALSKKYLPVISVIRPLEQIEFAPYPDGIHDLIGHVPLIADPMYADYMQQMGMCGNAAVATGHKNYFEILYLFAEEFSLGYEQGALKLFGPALFSAKGEAKFALGSRAKRALFDPHTVMRTDFNYDEFQTKYFVFDSFEHLCEVPSFDFNALYKKLDNSKDRKACIRYCKDAKNAEAVAS